MRILGVIPARGGSKGIPRKNVTLLHGKPLLVWTIEAALLSTITHAIVSTDDEEIARVAREHGIEAPFKRPSNLADDSARVIPVLQHALTYMEREHEAFDALMMLQPTSPMRTSRDIDSAIALLSADPTADSVISVVSVGGYHPARMKYLENNLLIDPPFVEMYENQPRAELRPMYIRNGAIYLVRRDTLMCYNSLKGNRCVGLILPAHRSVNIDTPFDMEFATWLMSKPNWDIE